MKPSPGHTRPVADEAQERTSTLLAPPQRSRGVVLVAFASGIAAGLLVALTVGRMPPRLHAPQETPRVEPQSKHTLGGDPRLASAGGRRWGAWVTSDEPPPRAAAPMSLGALLPGSDTARTGD